MAAVHPTMATAYQSLPPPGQAGHNLSLSPFPRGRLTPSPSPRLSPSPARRMTPQALRHRHIWIVAGTSCCGKTTTAENLARQLNAGSYIEGDDLHPEANRKKMSAGKPLTDEDRAPWLKTLKNHAIKRVKSNPASSNVVITCSALKEKYRDVFRRAEKEDPSIKVHFLFLIAPEGVLVQRAESRQGHFFNGASMIKSQFATLELPDYLVETDVSLVDCTKSEKKVERYVYDLVSRTLGKDSD